MLGQFSDDGKHPRAVFVDEVFAHHEHVEQVRRGFVHLRVECVEIVGIGLRDNASCRVELAFLHGVLVMRIYGFDIVVASFRHNDFARIEQTRIVLFSCDAAEAFVFVSVAFRTVIFGKMTAAA